MPSTLLFTITTFVIIMSMVVIDLAVPSPSPQRVDLGNCEQVYLPTELVPAQRAGITAHRAGASPASRYNCSPSWCQPSEQVQLLTELVPAQQAVYLLTEQVPAQQAVYLLTELVPAQQAGIPAHRAGASPASRYTCSPSWCQPSEQVYLLTELVPAQ
ncbi:hypothetical protein PCANC_04745 [Puccinia coronata f. sp. avenae]|uniref:Uncharacterized protein n=1 Tax=Puccinia coronata f. sp. avenae TaxID=200324 RepID=A0A2N5VIX3_9BASI|nr:hypothetical protein PCASD_01324 [Puccinia coronata f. sp. avenae]PLW54442.1 hypothetical protein PCANC_04745 [Puccinia coronata f. sp. avenae]